MPFVLGACPNLLGGVLSDYVVRRIGLRNGQQFMGAISLAAGALCVLATALCEGKLRGVVLISIGYGCMDLMLPSAWAMWLDRRGRFDGAVSGAMNPSGHTGAMSVMLLVAAFVFSRIDASHPIVVDEPAAERSTA